MHLKLPRTSVGRLQGGPTPPYDHDPKGPDNKNFMNKKKENELIGMIPIIIGPFGVMVIRGRGTPLCISIIQCIHVS